MADAQSTADAAGSGSGSAGPPSCPPGYAAIGSAETSSSYRVVTEDDTDWRSAEAACEGDQQGSSSTPHLVVPDTAQERLAMSGQVTNPIWTGVFAMAPAGPWTAITGGPMPDAAGWETGEPSFDMPPPDGAALEYFQGANPTTYGAQSFDDSFEYICECDGTSPVDPPPPPPPPRVAPAARPTDPRSVEP